MNARVAGARSVASAFDWLDGLLTERVRRAVSTWGLAVVFVMITAERTASAIRLGYVAVDLRIYRAAAEAAIHGADPWRAGAAGLTFAAPPPMLIPYIPAALVPEPVAIVFYAAFSIAAAAFVLRTLRLPFWWLLFPPLAESVVVLNADVFVIALLLGSRRWAFASIVFKVYAAVPLVIQRRWVAVIVGGLVCALSLPLLATFVADRALIGQALDVQASGGLSVWGSWLMVPTIAALILLGRRGADWLAVPALWPYTQLHYNVLALPIAAASPVVAFLLSLAVWPLPAVAAMVYAVQVVLTGYAAPYRAGVVKTAPSSPA